MPIRLMTPMQTHATSASGDLRVISPIEVELDSDPTGTRCLDPLASPFSWRISVPRAADIIRNILEARELGPLTNPIGFYEKVKSKGDWDYKRQGQIYENFGNWHFGVMAAAAGWPKEIAMRGAGAYQILHGTSSTEWGTPFDLGIFEHSSFGDDPRDQLWIVRGYEAYLEYLRQNADPGYWERLPYVYERQSPQNYQP